jgi:hypothetical protein
MIARTRDAWPPLLLLVVVFAAPGCRDSEKPAAASLGKSVSIPGAHAATPDGASNAGRTLQPVTIGAGHDVPVAARLTGEEKAGSVMQALRPLQTLVGSWRGITHKEIGGAKAVEEPEWVWDLRTDREQPALAMRSDTSPYFASARLTYMLDEQKYRLITLDREGTQRVYSGTFTRPVDDVPGDDDRLQRTFALEFLQIEPAARKRLAKVVFHQQDNNRYLLEVYDQRGEQFARYDTVGNQRQGTSFALSDTGYGEKTCIVSQGLGTIAISHAGRTYYVCCTGCKAAFEEEPERWIEKLAQRSGD